MSINDVMAMEVGADLRNMNECYHMPFNMAAGKDVYAGSDLSRDNGGPASEEVQLILTAPGQVGSIMVNRHGERFTNESCSYDENGRSFERWDSGFMEWRNIPGFLICDGSYNGILGAGQPLLADIIKSGEFPSYLHVFDTMEELASGMGIDGERLLNTVERYNGFCQTGVDLDWNRGVGSFDRFTCGDLKRYEAGELKNPCLAPLVKGPFYCIEVYPGLLQTAGGLVINSNAQVLNVRGEVIPRLYAGSCTIASPLGRGYGYGGATIANGYVVGYVAGNHIGTLKPWETSDASENE